MSNTPDDNKYELFREASKGNTDAFTTICSDILPEVREWVRSHCFRYGISPDRETVMDLTHQTLADAIDKCSEDIAKPGNAYWLFEMARTAVRRQQRQSGRTAQPNSLDHLAEAAGTEFSRDPVEDADAAAYIRALLTENRFPTLRRLLLSENITQKAAAEELGVAVRTLRRRYHRELAEIKKLLQEKGMQ